jgi:hypothetical protein
MLLLTLLLPRLCERLDPFARNELPSVPREGHRGVVAGVGWAGSYHRSLEVSFSRCQWQGSTEFNELTLSTSPASGASTPAPAANGKVLSRSSPFIWTTRYVFRLFRSLRLLSSLFDSLQCRYQPHPCLLADQGCPVKVSNEDFLFHLDNECEYNKMTCPRGGKDCGGAGNGVHLVKNISVHLSACLQHKYDSPHLLCEPNAHSTPFPRCTNGDCTTIGSWNTIRQHQRGCNKMDLARTRAVAKSITRRLRT